MRNLIFVLSLSWLYPAAFGQLKTKKHLRWNKTPEKVIIPEHKSHSRALLIDGDRLLTGSADGSIYLIDLNSLKQQLLFQQPNIKEIRDLAKTKQGYIAVQSAESSKVILIRQNGEIRIDKSDLFNAVFLDGLDVKNNTGFLMGDPKDGFISLFKTSDGGKTWHECEGKIPAMKDEGGYAASGTNVQIINDSTYVFVTGGMTSRFFITYDGGKTWKDRVLPYYPGKSTGPYSICFSDEMNGMMVGGDYKDKDIKLNTCFYTLDGGESWLLPENSTRGYRSCVISFNGVYYSCGTNGIDVSLNNGVDWAAFADGNYLSMTVWKNYLIASAGNGEIHFYYLIKP